MEYTRFFDALLHEIVTDAAGIAYPCMRMPIALDIVIAAQTGKMDRYLLTRQVYQSRYVEAFLTIIQQMPATVVPGFGREVRTHGIYAGRVAQGMLTLVTPRVYGCACCDDRMTSSRWSAPRL